MVYKICLVLIMAVAVLLTVVALRTLWMVDFPLEGISCSLNTVAFWSYILISTLNVPLGFIKIVDSVMFVVYREGTVIERIFQITGLKSLELFLGFVQIGTSLALIGIQFIDPAPSRGLLTGVMLLIIAVSGLLPIGLKAIFQKPTENAESTSAPSLV